MERCLTSENPDIVYQNVDCSELLNRSVHKPLDITHISHVGWDCQHIPVITQLRFSFG
jgi:hypothetical protein